MRNKRYIPVLLTILLFGITTVPGYAVVRENTPVSAKIPVMVTNKNFQETQDIVLHDETYDKSSTIHVSDEGSFTLVFDEPGTFSYTVRQEEGKKENVAYDDTIYEISVMVTSDDDVILSAAVSAYTGEDEKSDTVSFVNKQKSDEQRIHRVKTNDKSILPHLIVIGICILVIIGIVAKKEKEKEE